MDSVKTLLNDSVSGNGKKYALTMLDSWGKLESGMLEGNLKWMGLYYECRAAKPLFFKPKYCSVYIGKFSSGGAFSFKKGVTLGVCFPNTCTEFNINSMFSPISKLLKENIHIQTRCEKFESSSWDAKDRLGLSVLCFIVFLVILSTLYDSVKSRKRRNLQDSNGFTHLGDSSQLGDVVVLSKCEKLLMSFSATQNLRRLLATTQRRTDIHCLHGLRFLSMCWIILGHSFLFPVFYSKNLLHMARYYVKHWHFQAVGNAYLSVDSFFFLSGLLVAYIGMRQLKKSNGRLNIVLMYLNRYMRLTPPYAFFLLFSVSLWPKLGDGPMWSSVVSGHQKKCSKYWYTNLLYVNNLYPANSDHACFEWGWYLANDFQFYLLSPIFLYLLHKFPGIGLSIMSLTAISSISITAAFSFHSQQLPQSLMTGILLKKVIEAQTSLDDHLTSHSLSSNPTNYYVTDLYTKPWCRIGAYIVGMMTGYIVHRGKIQMPTLVVVMGWLAATVINCMVLFGLYVTFSKGGFELVPENMLDYSTAAFYNAVSRPVWCIGLAWIVLACFSGYGGPVNIFLSWPGFIPLSRLTYCIYLVHPMVIWCLVATSETLFQYDIKLVIVLFCGVLILSTIGAFFVSLMLEMPMVELLNILKNRDGNTASVKPESVCDQESIAPRADEEDS